MKSDYLGYLDILFNKLQIQDFSYNGCCSSPPHVFPVRYPFLSQWRANHPCSGETDLFLQGMRTKSSLLGHTRHGLLGCVLQVDGGCNWEPAVTQYVLGFVDIGSYKGWMRDSYWNETGCGALRSFVKCETIGRPVSLTQLQLGFSFLWYRSGYLDESRWQIYFFPLFTWNVWYYNDTAYIFLWHLKKWK